MEKERLAGQQRLLPFISSCCRRRFSTKLAVGIVALAPTAALASDYFYCTATSSYIYLGDSLEKVTKLCGKPSESSSGEQQPTHLVERWTYVKTLHSAENSLLAGTVSNHITFSIDFEKGKVKDIIIGRRRQVMSTNLCRKATTINVGDSEYQVQSVCGSPRYKETFRAKQHGTKQITTYRYDSFTGATTMKFRNDKLVKIDP